MAGVIGPDLKEKIRDANDIVDVINSYVPLKRAGANFMALCPFHREKTPSFNVNPSKQIFHCFGCGKGGDVFAFVQEFEHMTFPEAAKRLAERARIPLEFDNSPADRQRGQVKEQLFKIHEALSERWHHLLLNDAQGELGRTYLENRGIPAEAVEMFRIGFAPDEWTDTLNWAKSKGFEVSLLEKAGLVTRKEGSDHYYDRFRKRLMFPINDVQGRVIAFSGRIIDEAEKGGKYVNSPETLIFKKGSVLFGLDKARQAAHQAKSMIVCEGQLDTIACHVNGIKNVVAPQGTALTADHARVLKRHVSEVVLCFDSDGAGQSAIQRSFDDLLAAGTAVRVAQIPAPHDPDSFIKENGADAFRELTNQGAGYFDYLLNFLCSQNDRKSDLGRKAIVSGMAEAVNKTGDAVLIDTYAQKTSHQLGVTVEAMRKEFSKTNRPRFERVVDYEIEAETEMETEGEHIEIPRPSTLEFWLLKLIVGDCEESLIEWLFQHLDVSWVEHPVVRAALVFRLDHLADQKTFEVRDLVATIEEPQAASMVTEAATDNRTIPNPKAQLSDIVLRLRNLHIDQELRQLSHGVEDPDMDELTKAAHVLELQQQKRQPLEALPDV